MKLLETFKTKRDETQADLWQEYRAILRHQDSENSGDDADRLAELVDRLDIDPAHVELHAVVVAERDRLANESTSIGNAESELAGIVAEQAAVEREYADEIAPALERFRERAT